jgi:hypothetical protein
VHIEPVAYRLVLLWVGADAENVAIEILYLHLEGPFIIRGRIANPGARSSELLIHLFDFDTVDPHPAAGVALVALREKQVATASGN